MLYYSLAFVNTKQMLQSHMKFPYIFELTMTSKKERKFCLTKCLRSHQTFPLQACYENQPLKHYLLCCQARLKHDHGLYQDGWHSHFHYSLNLCYESYIGPKINSKNVYIDIWSSKRKKYEKHIFEWRTGGNTPVILYWHEVISNQLCMMSSNVSDGG